MDGGTKVIRRKHINDIYTHNTKYNRGRLSADNGIFRDNCVGVFVDPIATSMVKFSAATLLTKYAKRIFAFYERGAISTSCTVRCREIMLL